MKIAAIVIIYHPGDTLLNNIQSFYTDVDVVYVFDNSEEQSAIIQGLLSLQNVNYYQDGINEGIAKRLNQGMRQAIQDGCDWVLTMDQDSYFAAGGFSRYIQCFKAYKAKENVAMFGPVYGRRDQVPDANCQSTTIHELITSGALLNVDLYNKTGAFDEALFIDSVDHDYCIRSLLNGHLLIQFSNIHLSHELGSVVRRASIKSLFIVKKTKAIHSPIRCYYMYRNLLYLEQKYAGHQVKLLKSIRATAISNISNCIFYGRETSSIILYLLAARADYRKVLMGKCTHQF